jgi:hypothetical protein
MTASRREIIDSSIAQKSPAATRLPHHADKLRCLPDFANPGRLAMLVIDASWVMR